MNNSLYFYNLLMLVFLLILGLNNLSGQGKKSLTHPLLKTDKDTIQYDTIIQHSNTSKVITVSNKGGAPLKIYNVRSSCGVSVPSWQRLPINPGENGYIRFSYNSSYPGNIDHKLIIHSNCPENTKIINLIGFIIPENGE